MCSNHLCLIIEQRQIRLKTVKHTIRTAIKKQFSTLFRIHAHSTNQIPSIIFLCVCVYLWPDSCAISNTRKFLEPERKCSDFWYSFKCLLIAIPLLHPIYPMLSIDFPNRFVHNTNPGVGENLIKFFILCGKDDKTSVTVVCSSSIIRDLCD